MNDRGKKTKDKPDAEIYGREPTFMGVPYTRDLKGARAAKAAILGIPFDSGVHPTRVGARLGPKAIRDSSALVRPYWPPHRTINPVEMLGVVDCGDARVWKHGGTQQVDVDFAAHTVSLNTLGTRGQHTVEARFNPDSGQVDRRTIHERFEPYNTAYVAMMRDMY